MHSFMLDQFPVITSMYLLCMCTTYLLCQDKKLHFVTWFEHASFKSVLLPMVLNQTKV